MDFPERARLPYTYADASRIGVLVGLGAAYVRTDHVKARRALTQASADLDTGLIDMGSWNILRVEGAIQPDRIVRTRNAIQALLQQVAE
ncbi:hypothetical protein HN371_25550 [Candidatus Poribacteria bacterium]|jgi:hypothetical protein|nr:hypothetical protein [Candidatus Poribacteria bacterium]MBT5709948.1 hypothetical protein [Candidatus Poribacteria bacterium]MBT7809111.1 hypothetical protein [Candidatus Poribacteria bacterium]